MTATSKKAPGYVVVVDEEGNPVNFSKPSPGSITTDMFASDAKAPLAGEADTANSVYWNGVQDRPTEFPPSAHNHPISQIEGLKEALDEKMSKNKVEHLDPIADPATATIEDVANAYNTLLSALKGVIV